MAKYLIILIIALFFEAMGVVLLSKGMKDLGSTEMSFKGVSETIRKALTSGNILLGVAMEAVFFGALLYLLKREDVSVIWPLTSLGFVLTTVAAKVFLHERVDGWRWTGVALIVLGAGLISWSEKQNEKTEKNSSPASEKSLKAPG